MMLEGKAYASGHLGWIGLLAVLRNVRFSQLGFDAANLGIGRASRADLSLRTMLAALFPQFHRRFGSPFTSAIWGS